jgi:hypothetical protein
MQVRVCRWLWLLTAWACTRLEHVSHHTLVIRTTRTATTLTEPQPQPHNTPYTVTHFFFTTHHHDAQQVALQPHWKGDTPRQTNNRRQTPTRKEHMVIVLHTCQRGNKQAAYPQSLTMQPPKAFTRAHLQLHASACTRPKNTAWNPTSTPQSSSISLPHPQVCQQGTELQVHALDATDAAQCRKAPHNDTDVVRLNNCNWFQ